MKTTQLRYVAAVNELVLSEDTSPDFAFKYIDISQVDGNGAVTIPAESMMFKTAPSRARRLANPGSTVISTVRTYLRAIATVPAQTDPLVFSTGFAVLRPVRVDPRFLGYACRSEVFVSEVVARSVGVSYPAISPSDLMGIHLPTPELEIQRRIADFLDDRVARIDRLIETRRAQRDLVEEWLTSAYERVLGQWPAIPTRYLVRGIGVGIVIQPARLYTEDPDGVPALRGVNVREGGFSLDSLVKITPAGHFENGRSALSPGDLVVVRTGDAGSAAVVTEEMAGWNCIDLVLVRPRADVVPELLAFTLNAAKRSTRTSAESSGSIQQHLGAGALAGLAVHFPDLARQASVLTELSAAREAATAMSRTLGASVALLQEYKKALITAAVVGDLDVTTAGSGIPR